MKRLSAVLATMLATFEPRGRATAVARSLVAAAQATILIFNSDGTLFARPRPAAPAAACDGLRTVSLWCLAGDGEAGRTAARIGALLVLVLAAAGLSPRWTCVPHWYVSLSFSLDLHVYNGGEHVAQILTLLWIPMCLADPRRWQWRTPAGLLAAEWRGAALAAHLVLRLQVAVVYWDAAFAKAQVPQWRDGTAMYAVIHEPGYGFASGLLHLAGPALSAYPVIAALTWGAVLTETALGVLVLGGRRMRRAALALGLALHLSILAAMGLATFELIMVGALLAVWGARTVRPLPAEALPVATERVPALIR